MHSVKNKEEKRRVEQNRGVLYKSEIPCEKVVRKSKAKKFVTKERIYPGRIGVTRMIGFYKGKIRNFGGLPGIFLEEAEFKTIKLNKEMEIILLFSC